MYQFALTPRWLAGHALAGGLLVIFVLAGFWQLSRHAEVRDRNAAAAERQGMPALDANGFFEAVSDPQRRTELEYRTVTLPVGRFYWSESVQIRHRSLNGLAGCHVAVPMATDADAVRPGVLVVGGWLPQRSCEWLLAGQADVFGHQFSAGGQVTGRIRPSQERGLLGPSDPAQGQLDSLARTDVGRIDQQTTLDLVPVYVELVSAADETGASLELGALNDDFYIPELLPVPAPELDAGPHLGYALQWFSFAAVAIVGYALVLRHQARRGESEQIADD